MRTIIFEKWVVKIITHYQSKHQKQIKEKILSLKENPLPNDGKMLTGYPNFYRCDVGEYRVIYRFDIDSIYILLVGKRNDSEVFKKFKHKIDK